MKRFCDRFSYTCLTADGPAVWFGSLSYSCHVVSSVVTTPIQNTREYASSSAKFGNVSFSNTRCHPAHSSCFAAPGDGGRPVSSNSGSKEKWWILRLALDWKLERFEFVTLAQDSLSTAGKVCFSGASAQPAAGSAAMEYPYG